MSDLDEPGSFSAIDRSDALGDVERAAAQWEHARALAGDLRLDLDGITAVLVLGMGGSGISGDVVAAIAGDRLDVPVVVHKGYGLPVWVSSSTLVLAASYSGTTGETVDAAEVAIGRGARLLAVTTGGELGEVAASHGFPTVRPPPGRQPRHSLGYLAVPLLAALGLDEGLGEAIDVLAAQEAAWHRDLPTVQHPLKALAARFADGTIPVAYGVQGIPALAAARLGQQLNENAKLPALTATLPELCHNAVVGWEGESALVGRAGVVWLRDPSAEHPGNACRLELVGDVLSGRVAWQAQIEARGVAPLARLASLLHQADLLSVYAAIARGIDPTPIASIDRLKAGLAARPVERSAG